MCVLGPPGEVEWTLELVGHHRWPQIHLSDFSNTPWGCPVLGHAMSMCGWHVLWVCRECWHECQSLHASCRGMLRTVNTASLAHCFQAVKSLSGYTFHFIWNSVLRVCALGWVPSILFCALSFLCSQHGQHETFCTAWTFWVQRFGFMFLPSSPLGQVRSIQSGLSCPYSVLAQLSRRTRKEVLVADSGFQRSHSRKQAMAY